MNTFETDVEVKADGSLKLLSPLPAWLQTGRVLRLLMVEGTAASEKPRRVVPQATPEMLEKRKSALAQLQAMGGLCDVIPDPAAWQREMREDVALPGRD